MVLTHDEMCALMEAIRAPAQEERQMERRDGHLALLSTERNAEADSKVVREVAHMIRDALQARVTLVREVGEGVEYETLQVRDRLNLHGIDADLSAIRIGEYFKVLTEFNLLQRIDRQLQTLVQGKKVSDNLNSSEDGI